MVCNVTGTLYQPDGTIVSDRQYMIRLVDSTISAGPTGGIVPDITPVGCSRTQFDYAEISGRYHVRRGNSAASRTFDLYDVLPADSGVEWDFGDGYTGSGLFTDHSYAKGVVYNTSITIRLPDGQIYKRTCPVNIQGPDLIEMVDAGFLTYENGTSNLSTHLDLTDGLQLGATGAAATVRSKHLRELMGTEEFAFRMTLESHPGGSDGEVLRIHGGIIVSVNSKGFLNVNLWNADGVLTQVSSADLSITDGEVHTITLKVEDELAQLFIDDILMDEEVFTGRLRALGARDLTFGNPWGQANFHGRLTKFSVTIDDSAYVTVESDPLKDRLERAINKIIAAANEALLEIQNS